MHALFGIMTLVVSAGAMLGCLGPLGPTSAARGSNGQNLTNCKSFTLVGDEVVPTGGPNSSEPTFALLAGVYYNAQVQPLVGGRCATAGCHVAGGQPPNFATADALKGSYTAFLERAKDVVRVMPPAGSNLQRFSAPEVATLETWKSDGFPLAAPNATPTPTPTPTPGSSTTGGGGQSSAPTFKKEVQPFLTAMCMTCHKTQEPKNLDQYSYAKDSFDSLIQPMKSNGSDKMPPSGALPDGVKLLEDWKAGGFIEGTAEAGSGASSEVPGGEGVCRIDDLPAAQRELYLEMITPKEMKKCNEENKQIYSRVSKKCVDGSEVSKAGECTMDWAKAQMEGSNEENKTKFADQVSQGYVVEQCGVQGGNNVFFMTKFDLSNFTITKSSGYRATPKK